MKVELEIIEILKKVVFKRKLLLSTFLLIPIIGFTYKPEPYSWQTILFMLFIIVFVIVNVYYRNKTVRYAITDKLHVSLNGMKFNEKAIDRSEIKCIDFYYAGYTGEDFPFAPAGVSLLGTKDGAGNVISIHTLFGVEFKISVLIKSEMQAIEIKTVFDQYIESGIEVNWIKIQSS